MPTQTPVTAYLGLGSNLGCREDNLRQAIAALREQPGMGVKRLSAVYETEPWGRTDQPRFLNMVAEVETVLSPEQLLAAAQAIEAALGRERTARWAPRVLDIDILLYGDERIATEALTIPHPLLAERQFALVPLAELVPDARLPGGRTVGGLADPEAPKLRRLGPLE